MASGTFCTTACSGRVCARAHTCAVPHGVSGQSAGRGVGGQCDVAPYANGVGDRGSGHGGGARERAEQCRQALAALQDGLQRRWVP